MSGRNRVVSQAQQYASNLRTRIGSEIRASRLAAGLRLRDVAAPIGRSATWFSRLERGMLKAASAEDLVLACAVVGLRLHAAVYPAERAIRDAPQLALLRRLRARIGEGWSWRYEVITAIARDRRAADAVIQIGAAMVMVEAFTRLADAQAQLRAVLIKARDLGIERVVIAVAATHANRRALAAAGEIVHAEFPLGTREVLAALEAGRMPGANGIVVL